MHRAEGRHRADRRHGAGRRHRATRPGFAVAAAFVLAGCGAGAQANTPTWVPKPSFQGEGQQPSASAIAPQPSGPSSTPSTGGGPATPAPTSASAQDPTIVATNLSAPGAVAILPDNTALVGERTTGRIVRVQPKPNQPVPTVRTLTGLSSTGGGGLLDLALSPNYLQDSLIFAYVTTATDNRVIAFTLTGAITPVLTGIPRGTTDNGGRFAFGDDGQLYIGTGDAGHPALAADPHSLAGKVLRVSDIGNPSRGNPVPTSPVFTSGHHAVAGLCLISGNDVLLEVEPKGTDGYENVNLLIKGGSYGWPRAKAGAQPPLTTLPAGGGGPGGCTVQSGNLYVTSLDGKELLASRLARKAGALSAGKFSVLLKNKYGRLRAITAAPDGALWMTTSNRDGNGNPVPTDERVLRYLPSGGGAATYPG